MRHVELRQGESSGGWGLECKAECLAPRWKGGNPFVHSVPREQSPVIRQVLDHALESCS